MVGHLRNIVAVLVLGFCVMSVAFATKDGQTSAALQQNKGSFTVTLLGTGMPVPSIKRFGGSTLVQAGDTYLLFDVGRGAFMRLWQMGLTRGDLNAVFLTHLHSDHTVGLPDLYITGWLMDQVNKRLKPSPFVIYGPGPIKGRIGTKKMMKRIKAAYASDIYIREHDEKLSPKGLKIEAHNIDSGVVYNKHGVKVTAFPVNHGPWAKPAFGYRIDYGGRSVVLTGDTTYSPDEPLLEASKDADVVVAEVFAAGPKFLDSEAGRAIKNHHETPQQAGKVFSQIHPRLAVYTHLVLLAFDENARPTESDVIKETHETYNGPVKVGHDLDQIVIGKDHISFLQPELSLLPVASASEKRSE